MSQITHMILGGNGTLGSQYVRYLLENNSEVSVVSVGRSPEKPAAFSLYRGVDDQRLRYHQIHIAQETDRLLALIDAVRPSVIVNFAAQAESSASWKSSWQFFETNNVALAKIAEKLVGVAWFNRWVQIGSSEVYGATANPATEDSPLCPMTPYSASKAAADLYLLSLYKVMQFPVVVARPSGVYGPGQGVYRVIPKAVLYALTGQKLPLEGGGTTEKCLLHTDDLSRAVDALVAHGQLGRIYNVGPTEGVTIKGIVELIAEKTGIPFEQLVTKAPNRPGQDIRYLLDSSRLMRELGWRPQVTLSAGIDTMVNWVRKHLDFLKTQPTKYEVRA